MTESARLPQQGTWGVSYNYSNISFSESKDEFGSSSNLDFGLSKSYSFEDSLRNVQDSSNRTTIKTVFTNGGIGSSDTIGEMRVKLQIERAVHIPKVSYSFSDRWQSQVLVPVYETRMDVNSDFVPTGSLRELKAKNKGFSESSKSFSKMTTDPLNMELNRKGYDPLETQRDTGVGDITLKQRFSTYDDEEVAVTLEQITTAPTGRPYRATDPVDMSAGDGQWDLGLGVAFEMNPPGTPLGLQIYGAYINQLPNQGERRVPEIDSDELPSDVDQDVEVDLGDIVQAQLTTSLPVVENVFFKSSYAMITKQRDSYRGSLFEDGRYNELSNGTNKTMDLMLLGLEYSTFRQLSRANRPTNWSGQLAYISVLSGENVMVSDQWQFDVSLYF